MKYMQNIHVEIYCCQIYSTSLISATKTPIFILLRMTFMIFLGFTFTSEWNMQFKEHMKRWLIFSKNVLRPCRADENIINTLSLCVVNSVDSKVTSFPFLYSVMPSACSKSTLLLFKNPIQMCASLEWMLFVFFNVELMYIR